MNATRREIIGLIEELSALYPEMRFGQLVVNLANLATERPDAVYDVEDQEFLAAAREFLHRRAARSAEAVAPAKAG